MRGILESYDSELAATEYSAQLSKRVKEAEDMLQKTQNYNTEMEVHVIKRTNAHSQQHLQGWGYSPGLPLLFLSSV